MTLQWNLKEIGCGGVEWINLTQRRAPVAGFFEHFTGPSRPIKAGKFIYQLSDWWLMKNSAHWNVH
jgi:hypothetical protein